MPEQTIWGGLPRAAELRTTNDGKPWVTFTVADSARYKDDQGEWQSRDESYIDVVLWGDESSIVGTFDKGTQVACLGRFVTRKFEQDGKQRSVLQFKATKVAQLVRADRNSSAGQSPQSYAPALPQSHPAPQQDVWGAPGGVYDEPVF